MKSARVSIALLATAAMLAVAGAASAAPGLKLDRQSTSPGQCAPGSLLVNVHYRLLNDADSGFGGNYWANDTIFRHLQIWQESDGTYCVVVDDTGSFVTYAGTSPSGLSTVSAGITGRMEGGYITTGVVGSFDATLPTRGNLGSYDLQCDSSGNCPGTAVSWASYFSSITAADSFAQWGWIYHAGKHGTWLNQDDVAAADSGDVVG
jgi:hypothetical protein